MLQIGSIEAKGTKVFNSEQVLLDTFHGSDRTVEKKTYSHDSRKINKFKGFEKEFLTFLSLASSNTGQAKT